MRLFSARKGITGIQALCPRANPVWNAYQYDARGRTTRVTLPDGSVSRYEYTGNVVKVTRIARRRWTRRAGRSQSIHSVIAGTSGRQKASRHNPPGYPVPRCRKLASKREHPKCQLIRP